jgi:hypothetical protein
MLQGGFKGCAIMGVAFECYYANYDVLSGKCCKGILGAKFIFLMSLAFFNARGLRLVEGIDFILTVFFAALILA